MIEKDGVLTVRVSVFIWFFGTKLEGSSLTLGAAIKRSDENWALVVTEL